MGIQEVRIDEQSLFAWDGRVLEVVSSLGTAAVRRFHPAVTELEIAPDGKGRVAVAMNGHDASMTLVHVEPEAWERLQPLMDAFAAEVAAAH